MLLFPHLGEHAAVGEVLRSPAGDAVPAGPLGLSLCYICTASGGSMVSIKGLSPPRSPPRRGGAVGRKVRGFSSASRINMLRTINAINRPRISGVFFVTLTLDWEGVEVEESWRRIEAYRRAYLRRLDREYVGRRFFVVWKKEPHESGFPHLHLLIFWIDPMPNCVGEFRPWGDAAWNEITGGRASSGQRAVFMRSWNGVASYTSKYCAKDVSLDVASGRIWGVDHREHFASVVDLEVVEVRREVAVLVERWSRRWASRRGQRWLVFDRQAGRWRWAGRVFVYGRRSVVVGSLEWVRLMKLLGIKFKRVRPRLGRTVRDQAVWVEEVVKRRMLGARAREREVRSMVRDGSFDHFVGHSTKFLPSADVARLIQWAKSAWLPF